MGANRWRVEELRRAFENADCEHGAFMCSYCENDAIERAIDAAVAEAVALEARMRKRAIDEAVAAERESRSAIDEATNEIVELAASYSKTIPGMRDALQRLWDIDDASSTEKP